MTCHVTPSFKVSHTRSLFSTFETPKAITDIRTYMLQQELNRHTVHYPFSSVRLFTWLHNSVSFVLSLMPLCASSGKLQNQKITSAVHLSLLSSLFKQTSPLPPIRVSLGRVTPLLPDTHNIRKTQLQPGCLSCLCRLTPPQSPPPPPNIPPLQMVSFPNTLITHHPDE